MPTRVAGNSGLEGWGRGGEGLASCPFVCAKPFFIRTEDVFVN